MKAVLHFQTNGGRTGYASISGSGIMVLSGIEKFLFSKFRDLRPEIFYFIDSILPIEQSIQGVILESYVTRIRVLVSLDLVEGDPANLLSLKVREVRESINLFYQGISPVFIVASHMDFEDTFFRRDRFLKRLRNTAGFYFGAGGLVEYNQQSGMVKMQR